MTEPPTPPTLRHLSLEKGLPPRQLLQQAIDSTATYELAAELLGVAPLTLARWRLIYGLERSW